MPEKIFPQQDKSKITEIKSAIKAAQRALSRGILSPEMIVPVVKEDLEYIREMERVGAIIINNPTELYNSDGWNDNDTHQIHMTLTSEFNDAFLAGWLAPPPQKDLEQSA